LLTLGCAAPANAVDESIYQAIAGPWLFASEAADGACVVTLSSTLVGGHHPVEGAALCSAAVGAIGAASVWELDDAGTLAFRDRRGKPLIRLAEDADGQYYQPGQPHGSRLVLMAANEGSERLVRPADMTGRWIFQRPDGTPVCGLSFGSALLSTGSGFRGLTVAPECDAGLRKLKLVKWHIEGALLVLVGAETADLTLVPKADGSFAKSGKEGGKPLMLVRSSRQ
jgi:hypothetical protein